MIYKKKQLHTVTYVHAANLAAVNIMLTTFTIPFTLSRFLVDEWKLGLFVCKSMNTILTATAYTSSFTMTAIAWNKYNVITQPFKPRLTVLGSVVTSVTIWVFALVLSIPLMIFAQEVEIDFGLRTAVRYKVAYFPKSF